jgi:signal transduction histidine kinase
VTVEIDRGDGGRLPEPLEVAAYYVAAEGLTNVVKYAQATEATVSVLRDGDRVVLEITDDGIGGAELGCGSGLRGLVDRVETLDGRLEVSSQAGSGTRIRAEFPLAPVTAARTNGVEARRQSGRHVHSRGRPERDSVRSPM